MEQRYLANLKERRCRMSGQSENGESESRPKSSSPGGFFSEEELSGMVEADPKIAGKSLPDAIATILRERGHRMRARDIASELHRKGCRSKAKNGLLPSVLSALGRRTDLFHNVQRGVYELKSSEEP